MKFPIFQTQTDRQHLLQSLLIALSFTPPLETVHIQSIVSGFVKDPQDYINVQKFRGWLVKEGDLLTLSEKARRFVHLCHFGISTNTKEISRQSSHDVLLVRCLFICLLHLQFSDVVEIRKQKYYDNRFVPDLTVVTETQSLLIEIDRGKQPFTTLESKIRGLQDRNDSENHNTILIYFTDSDKSYNYFTQNKQSHSQNRQSEVQCIYLQSPTLAQDLLGLTTTNTNTKDSTKAFKLEDTEFNLATGFENINLNSQTQAQAANSRNNTRFQPLQLFDPITDKPLKMTTVAAAPNVFVFDPSLADIMQQPLPEEFLANLNNLQGQYTSRNPEESNFENEVTEVFWLLEQDGLTQDVDDSE